MKKLLYILLLLPVLLNAQTISGTGQYVIMIDDSDSIYFSSKIEDCTLVTNHNSVKQTPIINTSNQDSILLILSQFKTEIDTIPAITEWCEVDTYYKYDTNVILCLQSHYRMHFLPENTPALWLFRNPITCDDWVQPTGAHDAYNIGDCIMFEGNEYESLINANVWSPTGYPAGWQLK